MFRVTIQAFGVALVGAVLGWKLGLCSVLVYILIGAAGLPVFANFGGGIRSLIGLTGRLYLGLAGDGGAFAGSVQDSKTGFRIWR